MKWRRLAAGCLVVACGATLSLTSCGKKNKNNGNNGSNGENNVNGTPNSGTNGAPNGGTNGDTNNPPEPAEFGLDERPTNTTCTAFDRPPSPSAVTVERAFENLSFSGPVFMTQGPDGRWYVVQQSGSIRVFPDDESVGQHEEFGDISGRVNSGGEKGLLGLAFDPDWPDTPEVYLSYTRGGLESVVSRFTSDDGGTTFNEMTEEVLFTVDQPFENHNGGQIGFGPDGYLYFGLGDGGSAGDPVEAGQDTQNHLGKMLRIDVRSGEEPYGIPADNPFADGEGGLREIFAWGLRNPWRWSFDMETGTLWVGDVGQGEWEEISIVENGGNYGWDIWEGNHCYEPDPDPTCPDDGPWIFPVVEYPHQGTDESVTGGYVYRGSEIPSMNGVYIFGDFSSGKIWGVFENDQTGESEMQLLVESGLNISSFGQGLDGEVYAVNYGGTLHKLVANEPAGESNFPRSILDTGCVDENDPTRPASGLVPYTVNAPFWSDNARKSRFMALPDGETITVEPDGDWTFPVGTVLMKNFRLDGELFETRLFVRHEDGEWGGYSYEWNEDGTDATWVQGGKVTEVAGQQWVYPSGGDCMNCHTEVAGRALGPENAQLDGDFVYRSTNRRANQLATLEHIGMFEEAPNPDDVEELVDPFGDGDMVARARSYMHTNCSGCHRSGTNLRPKFDLTAWTNPLIDDELCDRDPVGDDLGVEGAKRLVPGNPDQSLLYLRMSRRDANGMPPLGSTIVHEDGAELVRQWIEGLDPCDL
jgi:uncharacterized repeat protein (TIGR03806 family)